MTDNSDTTELLRECDAGVRMGIEAIDEVADKVENPVLEQILNDSRREHEKLRDEIRTELNENGEEGKAPAPMAKGMSWIKTNVKMAVDKSDSTVSDLIVDGCGMGIKSLSRYINQYAAADERSQEIASKIIACEEKLSFDLRGYL